MPNAHFIGVCRGALARTWRLAKSYSSSIVISPSPSRSASPVRRPSTRALVKTDGWESASARWSPSNAYSVALDAVSTIWPVPGKASARFTLRSARGLTPAAKAPL
jgi:hypothetical protein